MFPDIGFSEILIVALVVLLVAKPQDIAPLMRKFGVAIAHIQAFLSGMWGGWREQEMLNQVKPELPAVKASQK